MEQAFLSINIMDFLFFEITDVGARKVENGIAA